MGIFSKLFSSRSETQEQTCNYVVVDIETTGLNPYCDGITELAAVRVRNGEIIDRFQELVNPGMKIPAFIESKTHITNEMVASADSIKAVLPRFLSFVGDDIWLGYNIDKFDLEFIKWKAQTEIGICINVETIDAMKIARRKLPDQSIRLDALRVQFGIDPTGAHRALKDCIDTHVIYRKLLNLPDAPEVEHPRWTPEDSRRQQQLVEEAMLEYEADLKRSKELESWIPRGFKPAIKPFIPTHYKERWEYVREHPFTTLASSIVSVTGSSRCAPRMAVENILFKVGALMKSSTTRDCDFCIALSEEAFGKLNGARSWQEKGSPIRIIGPEEFLELYRATLDEKPLTQEEIAAAQSEIFAREEAKKLALAQEKENLRLQKKAEKAAAKAKAQEESVKALADFDGPKLKVSPKRMAMWREEFTNLWNEILADDVIELHELTMLKEWLNRHKRRRDDYLSMLQLIDKVAEDGVVDYEEMQQLFGEATQVIEDLTPEGEGEALANAKEIVFQNENVRQLAEEYSAVWNPINPFLDTIYPASVQMPAADFTGAVAEWYGNNDFESIQELWKYIGGDNSDTLIKKSFETKMPDGLQISDFARNEAWAIYALSLRMSAMQGTKQSISVGGSVLATTLSTRVFSLSTDLLDALHRAIDDTDIWEKATEAMNQGDVGFEQFASMIKVLPPTLRMALAASALGCTDKSGAYIIPYELSYAERCYGCSEKINRPIAESLGIFDIAIPPLDGIPRSINRKALQDTLAANAIPFDNHGKREEYVAQLMEQPSLLAGLISRHAPSMKVISVAYAPQARLWALRNQALQPLAEALLKHLYSA